MVKLPEHIPASSNTSSAASELPASSGPQSAEVCSPSGAGGQMHHRPRPMLQEIGVNFLLPRGPSRILGPGALEGKIRVF